VGVQEIKWQKKVTVREGDYNFFKWKRNEYRQLGTGFLYTTEQYQQLRDCSVLAIGLNIVVTSHW
jgi:hypothetical protein